jgi:phenylacetate-coenzyme A ligase PaaK-like adenylate-forming protein
LAGIPATAVTVANEVKRRFDLVNEIDPAGLADLLGIASRPNEISRAVLDVVHGTLLARTVDHARRHVPWYRSDVRYAHWRLEDGLPTLPILNRDTVAAGGRAFFADNVGLRSVCHTSGTTGPPLEVPKSHEEVLFINRYFLQVFRPWHQRQVKPLTLGFPNFFHGTPVPLPSLGMTLAGGVTDDTLIKDAVRVLTRDYQFPGYESRISFLSGLGFHVLIFTSYLIEQGFEPAEFRLSGVTITGGYMSPHWRDFLRRSWATIVTDRFSLTESVGGATRCLACDRFHLDTHILGEVLDVDTGVPISEGVGELVLTTPYPFVQMHPLIRYSTGDLVRKYASDCGSGLTFTFLGRVKNAITLRIGERTEWLIFSKDLNRLITQLADVRKFEWFTNLRLVRDRAIGGLPICELRRRCSGDGSLELHLLIELLYAPHCYRDRVEKLREILLRSLRSIPDTTLDKHIRQGDVTLEVEFVGPGTLRQPDIKI